MPHLPDHATHDPELIAAFAAGDATGSALDEATALVAECADCAELHRDLRAITTALPELPAPARSRDFRLTDAQADALRPSGWRGLVAAFASPRFRLAAPLGTGLAAAGLAGLLLATPGGVFVTGSATSGAAASADPAAAQAAPEAVAVPEDSTGGAALAAPAASPAPAASFSAQSELDAATDGRSVLTGPVEVPASAAASLAPVAGVAGGGPAASADPEAVSKAESAVPEAPALDSGRLADASTTTGPATPMWILASALILVVGVALVVIRLVARRIARA